MALDIFPKKDSMMLSQEPCFGVNTNLNLSGRVLRYSMTFFDVCPQIIEYDPDALSIRIFLIFSSNSGSRHSRWYLIRCGFILAIADGIRESNSILLEEVEDFRYDLIDHMEECVEDGNYTNALEY